MWPSGKGKVPSVTVGGSALVGKLPCFVSLCGTVVVHILYILLPRVCEFNSALKSKCERYPDLGLFLFACWGFVHFLAAWFYVNLRQWQLPYPIEAQNAVASRKED